MDQPFPKRQHLLAVLIFAAAIGALFYRAILLGEVLAPLDMLSKELPWRAVLPADTQIKNSTVVDVLTVFYPWKHFVHDELQAGRFPLWCQHVGCGYPLAGEGVIKLFGLTTLCLWLASPAVASLLSFSAQLFVAMTGMYALLGALRLRWGAAVFGALIFGLNSAMIQHLEYEHISGGLMMLPWLCWALWRRSFALAGLFFGLVIINGSLQSAAIVWFSAAGFLVAVLPARRLQTLAGVTALGLLVGAIALLPNLELFALNTRARFDRLDWWELTWKRPVALLPWLAAMINPDVIGNYRTFDLMRALGRMGTNATTPTMSDIRVYCGLGALVLAVLGLRSRHPARRFGLWLLFVPLTVAVVTPFYLIVYFRALNAGACGVAVLAALGWERWLQPDERWRSDGRKVLMALAAGVGIALMVGAAVSMRREVLVNKVERAGAKATTSYRADAEWQRQKAEQTVANFSLGGAAVARFACVAALTGCLLWFGGAKPAAAALLIALNTGDQIELGQRITSSSPAAFDYPATPALEFLRQQPGLFRVSSWWDASAQFPTARANLLLPVRLDDPRVYESLAPANPLLDRQDWNALNVRFMICPPESEPPVGEWRRVYRAEVDIYENARVEPRVYFATEISGAPAGQVQVEEYRSGRMRFTLNAPQAGWLVAGERAYPGWRARLNGRPTPISVARALWQAVPVAAGENRVEFNYRPGSVFWGGALSLLGLGIWGWLWKKG